MAQKKAIKVPKQIGGFKLSKRTRRDLAKFAGFAFSPEAKALAGGFVADVAAHFMTRKDRKAK